MKPTKTLIMAVIAAGLLAGCGNDELRTPPLQTAHKHEHKPPHGGTPVELGEEENHLELVLDVPSGLLQAYVLDGEMENFIRVASERFEINAQLPDRKETLVFHAVANNATGETVGDTSQFEARADWLRTTKEFDAVLTELTVQGKKFQNVTFNFPKGNDKDEKK